MPIGAVVGSAVLGAVGSKRAADKQSQAADQSIAEQRRQYDQTRQDQMPWMQAGQNALANLQNPQESFTQSPSYNFIRGEGTRDIGNSFAAKGGALGGNALRALTQYNQNLASNEFGNWWNQQSGLAGLGQNATAQTAQIGQQQSTNVQNALLQRGDARASGVAGVANAVTGGVGNYLYGRGQGWWGNNPNGGRMN